MAISFVSGIFCNLVSEEIMKKVFNLLQKQEKANPYLLALLPHFQRRWDTIVTG